MVAKNDNSNSVLGKYVPNSWEQSVTDETGLTYLALSNFFDFMTHLYLAL